MNEDMVVALDLEMNQPSEKIIEIGAVIADINTGIIWERLELLVNPDELLSPDIIALTGITQEMVDTAPLIRTQYDRLCVAMKLHGVDRTPIVWGGGDSECLRQQLGLPRDGFVFGRRWTDVKTIFQAYCRSQHMKTASGLSKSMSRLGLHFKGRKHRGRDDAENTFHLYMALLKKFRR